MNKKELVSTVTALLKEENVRKPVSFPRHTFHISDSEGNHKDFIIKKSNKMVLYTPDDVAVIFDAIIDVMVEALKNGDPVSLVGIGVLSPHFRKPRKIMRRDTREMVVVPGHFVPRVRFGSKFKLATKLYELSLENFDPETGEIYGMEESVDDFDYDDPDIVPDDDEDEEVDD